MLLRIGQRQRRTPGATEHDPAFDAEVRADRFDVGDQMPGRVVFEFGMRRRLAGATLVEQHDAVARGSKKRRW